MVATSTLEAEYIALLETVQEVLWFQCLIKEIRINQETITIYINNKGTMDFARNAQFSQRTKHIDIQYHFIREHLESGLIKLEYILMAKNIADIFTKSLNKPQFEKLRRLMGMRSLGEVV